MSCKSTILESFFSIDTASVKYEFLHLFCIFQIMLTFFICYHDQNRLWKTKLNNSCSDAKRYCLVPFDHCPLRHTVLGPEFESTHEIRRLREKSIYLSYNTLISPLLFIYLRFLFSFIASLISFLWNSQDIISVLVIKWLFLLLFVRWLYIHCDDN